MATNPAFADGIIPAARNPFADPLDRLPPEARDHLEWLEEEATKERAIWERHRDDLDDIREEITQKDIELDRHQQAEEGPAHLSPLARYRATTAGEAAEEITNPRITLLQSQRVKLIEKRDRKQAALAASSAKRKALGHLAQEARRYLATLPPNVRCDLCDQPLPRLRKGETIESAIERCRTADRNLAADEQAVRTAPIHSSVAKAIIRQRVERLAEQARPSVGQVVETGFSDITWPSQQLSVHVLIPGSEAEGRGVARIPDPVALFAWAAPDLLISALERDLMAVADDRLALDEDTRRLKLEELAEMRLALQREEAALSFEAIRLNMPTLPRADLDPRAILMIEVS